MRVECSTIEEFLECLESVHSVFEGTLRLSIIRRPIDGTKEKAVKFEVGVQASAVVCVDKNNSYILETSEFCGIDYADSTQEFTGSESAKVYKETVESFAVQKGWKVLPGVIHP